MCQLTLYRVGFVSGPGRNQQSAPTVDDLKKAPFGCITMRRLYAVHPRPGKRERKTVRFLARLFTRESSRIRAVPDFIHADRLKSGTAFSAKAHVPSHPVRPLQAFSEGCAAARLPSVGSALPAWGRTCPLYTFRIFVTLDALLKSGTLAKRPDKRPGIPGTQPGNRRSRASAWSLTLEREDRK